MKSQLLISTSIALWLCICAFLTSQLIAFGARPGEKAQTIGQFPSGSHLQLAPDKFTLVAFIHPQCPCSKASIGELEELMTRCSGNAIAYVLFLKPTGCDDKFAKSDLFEQTSRMKNVYTIVDNDGLEAKTFGSRTSGQIMVYNPQGFLIFSGGITSSRGHYGDNFGLDAVTDIVSKKKVTFECSDVYGCPLFASTADLSSGRR